MPSEHGWSHHACASGCEWSSFQAVHTSHQHHRSLCSSSPHPSLSWLVPGGPFPPTHLVVCWLHPKEMDTEIIVKWRNRECMKAGMMEKKNNTSTLMFMCIAFMGTSEATDVLTSNIVNVELLSALLFIQSGLNNLCCICKERKTLYITSALSNQVGFACNFCTIASSLSSGWDVSPNSIQILIILS